jgi:hypothetical protein
MKRETPVTPLPKNWPVNLHLKVCAEGNQRGDASGREGGVLQDHVLSKHYGEARGYNQI